MMGGSGSDYHTDVTYTGTSEGNEWFLLTVPATMAPGSTDDVTLKGAWRSSKTYTVTADKTVEMKGSLGNDKTLDITFPGISLAGSSTEEVSATGEVSVESMTALFGKYEGTFNYNLTISGDTQDTDEDDEQALEAGLYSDGTMLASWDDLVNTYGLDIEKDYSSFGADSYKTDAGSGYSVITNNFSGYDTLDLVISDSITSIGGGVFSACTSLTSITIPNSVTSIRYNAFYGCTGLASITIPNSVTSIGYQAFYNCIALTSITIPDGILSIGDNVFNGCTGLTRATISNSVTTIEEGLFRNCTGLTSVEIPDSITSIGKYAFYGCSKLTYINYLGTQAQWNEITTEFNSCWNNEIGNYRHITCNLLFI